MKQLCLEQPKQLVLRERGVVDVKRKVGSHQISETTAHPVASAASGWSNHVICNEKCVMVAVLVQNDDQSWWTWRHFSCFTVVFCLEQRY